MSRAPVLALALLASAASAVAQPLARLGGPTGALSWAHRLPEVAPPDPSAVPDAWLGPDKAMHAGASFAMTVAGTAVLARADAFRDGRALPAAAAATLVLGLAKELGDARRPRHPLFSWRDLAADAFGVGLAVVVADWADLGE